MSRGVLAVAVPWIIACASGSEVRQLLGRVCAAWGKYAANGRRLK